MSRTLPRLLAAARRGLRRLRADGGLAPADLEAWRTTFVVFIFSTIGIVFLLGLGIDNLLAGRSALAVIDLGLAALALANAVRLRRTGDPRAAKYIVSVILIFLFVYLLTTGGVSQTGPLWCYVFVTMLMFVHGLREGAVIVGALFLASALLLLAPLPIGALADYPEPFAGRFLASLAALLIMALLYEYAREHAQRHMAHLNARMERAAYTDAVTGLASRRRLIEAIAAEHARARGTGRTYVLLEADVDGFKRINDEHGHESGDAVLTALAGRLASSLRRQDVVGRWGGEEFLALLPGVALAEAEAIAERVRDRIARDPVPIGDREVALTVSIGIAEAVPEAPRDETVRRADAAMYAAKATGKNTVVSSPQPA